MITHLINIFIKSQNSTEQNSDIIDIPIKLITYNIIKQLYG